MTLKPASQIYFLGIGGTGMAAVAGLCQEAGFKVSGSDNALYPPMSTMLAELGIAVRTPYSPANLAKQTPDLLVIANVLSRGHAELEAALASGIPYTSFPALLGEHILARRTSIVVAGTHGKTTTTSLLAHVLECLGASPGFLIGGIPRNFPRSFRLGKGTFFAIEGDEYDTAFFDKGPKFLHYRPKFAILNNLEFDHADIYPNIEAIEAQFAKLIDLVQPLDCVIANADDPGMARLLGRLRLNGKITSVATLGETKGAAVTANVRALKATGGSPPTWTGTIDTRMWGCLSIRTSLAGRHNFANIAQVIACIQSLAEQGHLAASPSKATLVEAIATFEGVARRLDLLASAGGMEVYEDFAHHPTAVGAVIEGFRAAYPGRRLVVAFEPRSASNRRNVFQDAYVQTLALADRVLIGECTVDQRIPPDQRFDAQALATKIGPKARAFPTNSDLLSALKTDIHPGDAVIFMSSGSFSGIQHQLAAAVKDRAERPPPCPN